jgi:steroid delta-isomerase-like uncharacterized protein
MSGIRGAEAADRESSRVERRLHDTARSHSLSLEAQLMTTNNMAIAKRLIDDVWSRGRLEVIDEIVAQGCLSHDPLATDLRGAEALKQYIRSMRVGFPDLQFHIDDIVAAGDEVYLRWTAKGTHKGNLLGMPATNRTGVIGGMAVNRFQNGKVVETWHMWDTLSMMQQLGYLPTLDKITTASPTVPRH